MSQNAPSALRILVADDEPDILDAYACALCPDVQTDNQRQDVARLEAELFGGSDAGNDPVGYDVTLARQGDEAVERVRAAIEDRRPYALAFLDIRMPPGMDGIETAARIRALDPHINIIFVSGYSDVPPQEITRRIAPADKILYCQKPLHAPEIEQFARAMTAKWAAERSLIAAKESAEAANRAKTQFLATMSHELRTPLNAIIGFSEIIERENAGSDGDPRFADYAKQIRSSGGHLLELINDILDLAKIEAGKFDLHEDEVDVGDVIERMVRIIGLRGGRHQRAVTVSVPQPLAHLRADERALKQVLLNLLSNAVKFTSDGGEIRITAGCNADRSLWIAVADNGVGMSSEEIPLALAPFEQVDRGLARNYEGTGLGLPLSVSLVELHGGSLAIESEPGAGTTVTVTFPGDRSIQHSKQAS